MIYLDHAATTSVCPRAVAEMKKLTAEHSLAAAQAKLSGSAQDGLRAKVTEPTSKIEVQKGIVQTQAKEYDNLKDQLVAQKEKHAELSKKVEEAKKAYCIISTSEKALYANVMLQKGVVVNK